MSKFMIECTDVTRGHRTAVEVGTLADARRQLDTLAELLERQGYRVEAVNGGEGYQVWRQSWLFGNECFVYRVVEVTEGG